MGRRRGKTDRELDCAKRRELVLTYRRMGANYRQIAAQIIEEIGIDNLPKNYDSRQVYQDLKRELEKARAEIAETAEEVRQIELDRLDEMHSRVYPVALGTEEIPPDMRAVDRVLKIGERRAALLGIDAPQKADIEIRDTTALDRVERRLANRATPDRLDEVPK